MEEQSRYTSQADFPAQCKECPMLVGMIEDGELPPDRRLDEEEKQEMREALGIWVVDSCPGPTIESNQANFAITCTAMDQLENSGINR